MRDFGSIVFVLPRAVHNKQRASRGRGPPSHCDALSLIRRRGAELRERFARFGLALHPDKTRLIEFGRCADRNRRGRGDGKPETFTFLGFTHSCGKTRKGRFAVLRQTMRRRWRRNCRRSRSNCSGACTRPSRSRAAMCARYSSGTSGTTACREMDRASWPFATHSGASGIRCCDAEARPRARRGRD
jgi:hypothetical protein